MRRSRSLATTSGPDSFHEICTVRIELLDTDPLIWRELEVPTSITLKVLHDIVQIAMGWFDQHLWDFKIGDQVFGPATDMDWGLADYRDAKKTRLRDVIRPEKTIIDYEYDFGDSWELRLTISNTRRADPALSYPRYIAGEWNGPPEDCGGIPGFYAVLDALADPDNPDHAELLEWLEDYDPAVIDELRLKFALGRIASRRNAARKRVDNEAAIRA